MILMYLQYSNGIHFEGELKRRCLGRAQNSEICLIYADNGLEYCVPKMRTEKHANCTYIINILRPERGYILSKEKYAIMTQHTEVSMVVLSLLGFTTSLPIGW